MPAVPNLPPPPVAPRPARLDPLHRTDLPEAGAGPGLSDEGKRQAEEAAQYIAEWRPALPPLAALYASPLPRTRETAAVLAKALDLAPVENRELVDCDTGEWAGAALKDLVKKPEWRTVVSIPERLPFPRGRVDQGHERQDRRYSPDAGERAPGSEP